MPKVKEIKETCAGCPSQWEGTLKNGASLYIKYRYGTLRIDVAGTTLYTKNVGGPLDGCMTFNELKKETKGILKWGDCEVKEYADKL